MLSIQEQRRRIAEELERLSRLKGGRKPLASAPAARLPVPDGEPEPVAIIGLSGCLPGCRSVDAFWRALDEDRRLLEAPPPERLSLWNQLQPGWSGLAGRGIPGGGFIPDIRSFAPEFFGVLPGQAHGLDPRQRLLLMSVYHTLEDAGYAPGSLKQKPVGVFVGIEEDEYFQTMQDFGIPPIGGDGLAASMVANRISWFFDFRGPSEVVNTMCSGAAVALHRAVCSLRLGESSMALVGAANLMLRPEPFLQLIQTGQLSPDLSIHSFGRDAQGFLRADGVASVLLKRLSQAESDGDPIYAVIRNTATNYNGKGGMSIAAPDIAAHAELIERCYRQAGIDPREVRYIEAQGMGQPVADLAEWQACNRALLKLAGERGVQLAPGACRIGSLKPMTGHMHSASALGALFKVIHCLRTETIHKILGFSELNADLESPGQPCAPARHTEPWPTSGRPRLAGLHAYGAGGNNAHILIQEYRQALPAEREPVPVIIRVSAESVAQRQEVVRRLLEAVGQHPEYTLAPVAQTLQQGRDEMACRLAFVAADKTAWMAQARAFLAHQNSPGIFRSEAAASGQVPDSMARAGQLAQAWAQGAAGQDWPASSHHRLHLPGYPFALKDCWFDHIPRETPAPARPATGEAMASAEAEAIVRSLLGRHLEMPSAQVDLDAAFVDQGFSSTMVAGVAAELNRRHSIQLEPARFFEFKSPRQLVGALMEYTGKTVPAQEAGSPCQPCQPHEAAGGTNAAPRHTPFVPIAIIGLAGRYPGASNLEEFWDNLRKGRDCITEIPEDHWRMAEHFDPNPETAARSGKSYGKWGGFISGLNEFDPLFFKISPLEAESMNPKERLVLQTVWHVLEDAGHTLESLAGDRVGVFFGVTRAGWDAYPGTFSSVANRVSYFCGFHGPSVAIDTMCSSSLVAIHEACQHLQTGGCDMAVAGGVNLYLHPSHFVVLAHGRFLSPDGKCRAFGAGANGMTPGEGVGAVLLKPMARALRDGDRIYGVIRGSASNHGGNANGFTVPNPAAQRDLVLQALQNASLHPRQITFVEAHGTGTTLGDPVEIRGLAEAYRRHTPERGFCRIGSLKSNLGHLEAAAGIASLTKVLLQMQHRELAPSIHAAELNPNIDFPSTPFVVQQAWEPWRPTDADGRPMARLAAVSSFGAGGSNAHLIVEEPSIREKISQEEGPQLIVLSARNEDRLMEAARGLHDFIQRQPATSLRDMACTLQCGREAMEERLAIPACSLEQLKERLHSALNAPGASEAVYRGRVEVRRHNRVLSKPEPDRDIQPEQWPRQRDLESLAKAWVNGERLNWSLLYPGEKPSRISLPLYPFARVLIPTPELMPEPEPARQETFLHPLAQRNTSTLNAQRFTSTLHGREFFLAHHVVEGRKMLPAAAYLEMARAAFERSLPERTAHQAPVLHAVPVWRLSQVVWMRPLCVAEEPVEVQIALQGDASGPVRFEIKTSPGVDAGPEPVHAQGSANFEFAARPEAINLEAIRPDSPLQFSAEQCYAVFGALGIDYGPGHRGIERLWAGPRQLLAKLRLPDSIGETAGQYVLHPSLLDAAFQATIGFGLLEAGVKPAGEAAAPSGNGSLAMDQLARLKPSLPYAVEQVEIFNPGAALLWAVIRRQTDPAQAGALEKFDLDLCDGQGGIQVRIRGFSARILREPGSGSVKPSLLLHVPHWEAKEAAGLAAAPLSFERRVVVSCGTEAWTPAALQAAGAPPNIEWLPVVIKGRKLARDYFNAVSQTLCAIRNILDARPAGDSLIQVVMGSGGQWLAHSGLVGMLRTAHLESPRLFGQIIQLDMPPTGDRLAGILGENAAAPGDAWIRYIKNRREVITWREYSPSIQAVPWKPNGVYLITGGMGGLGRIFAQEIATRATGANIILIGRSEPGENGNQFLRSLKDLGAQAAYWRVDLRHSGQVREFIRAILKERGAIHGILHAAGVLNDQYLLRKSIKDIETVLGPKVAGTVNLDEATRDVALDFLILFSSGATLGNPGQGDYAAANAFLDGFAHYRNGLVETGQRKGKTISIAWPFWKAGGMQMDPAAERSMIENSGLIPMDTQTGLDAFYRCLASAHPQILVLHGMPARLQEVLAYRPELPGSGQRVEKPNPPEKPGSGAGEHSNPNDELGAKLAGHLKRLIGETLKIQPGDMRADQDLYGYGLDSIIALEVNNRLEKDFPRLSKTLFFEYSTIQELAGYFLQAQRQNVERLFAGQAASPPPPPPALPAEVPCPPATPVPENPLPLSGAGPAQLPALAAETPVPTNSHALMPAGGQRRRLASMDEVIRVRQLDIDHPAPRPSVRPARVEGWPNWHSVFQSFAIFDKIQPGFSFSRMLAGGDDAVQDAAFYLQGQVDLRRLLFHKEDFHKVSRILDLGCGRAADLMELALSHPGLAGHGLTIDPGEAAFANRMIRRKGLAERVRVILADGADHEYEQNYDLAFSIQMMHFIPDLEHKRKLLRKVAAALRPGGVLLMAEFVCLLAKPMRDPALNVTVHTAGEWAGILGDSGLVLEEVVDASAGIINFLHDPDLDRHIAGLDQPRQLEIRKYNHQVKGLENRWVGYCVMRAVRDGSSATAAQRAQASREQLSRRTTPGQARSPKANGRYGALYRDLTGHFQDCVLTARPQLPLILNQNH